MSQPESAPSNLPPPKRGCRPIVIGLLGMGMFGFAVLAIGWLAVKSKTHSRYSKAVAEAERQDPDGWRLADLEAHRFQPPEGNNPADRVMEAFDLLPPRPFRPTARTSSPPDQEEQALNIGDVLDRLGEIPANRRLDEKSLAVLSSGLDELGEALEVARPLAETGEGRFPLEYALNPIDTPLPDIQNAREVARLLKLDAARRVLEGDPAGALESCRATLGAARAIGDEPILISQLVRAAFDGVALDSAEFVLGQGEASDEAIVALQLQLATEAAQPLILHAMKGERAMHNDLIEKLESGQIDLGSLSGSAPKTASRILKNNPLRELFFSHNRGLLLETMNRACEVAALPPEKQQDGWREFEMKLAWDDLTTFKKCAGMLVYLLVPGLDAAGKGQLRRVAHINAMIVLLSAERYRMAHGDWPAAVDDLKPFLPGGQIPIDPFSGQPILIRRTEDGFIAYSTSLDQTDDGGQIDEIRRYTETGQDLGFRLWNLDLRGLHAGLEPEATSGDVPMP